MINSKTGGAAQYLPVTVAADGTFVIGGISVSGLGLTTAGVTDSANKRFVTDAELAALQNVKNLGAEGLLADVTLVDLNTATPSALYTVPAGKTAVITKLIVSDASASLTTAKFSVGYNSATFNNVFADAAHAELVDNTVFSILTPKAGAALGNAADVLKLLANTLQGAPATVTVRVFGFLF